MMALRDRILAGDLLKRKEVDVPEWDATVVLREICAGERVRLFRESREPANGDGIGEIDHARFCAALLQLTLLDRDSGQPVFASPDEILNSVSDAVFNRLSSDSLVFSRLHAEAQEEATKNFSGTGSEGSSSD